VLNRNLALDGVTVRYGPKRARVLALDKVSLSFEPGELTLIMGPSGSGKTTLLSLLGCLLTPDQGSVFIEGCDVSQLKEGQRTRLRGNIGFIFQAFRLLHSLSAFENVMIAAEIAGDRRGKAHAARKLLVDLGLGQKLELKPDELSGGEKQRVAIARALLSDPPLVLADEPTASLDFKAGRQISEIMRKLAVEQRRTVIVVSHDQRWTHFAQRIVLLEDGRVIEDKRTMECEEQSSEYQPAALQS
jgi:putative ABC transport system ATP-binding protein